ncbi:MAG: adenylosuccinate lyase [Proteobacteria bacterium]|nr:MAG: adenylosuccinate lyase [Pseudomonadota bacterium]
MIERYSRAEMSTIFSEERRYAVWLEIETLALEAMVKEGLAPKESLQAVKAGAKFDSKRISEIEAQVKHDVIAFLTCINESVGPEARFLHRGMTSSDVLDTALAVQLKQAGELILKGLRDLAEAVKKRAIEFKETPCVGRSHGIHAEPTTFGLKLASWYAELRRHENHLQTAIEEISVGKIAGAVGTYASISPEVEAFVLGKLGLKAESVPSQIVHRDRHAFFFGTLAHLATSLEKFSIEIRHLQRTEVGELHEPFGSGQKGSSAMPHKKNPILAENISGLARLVRSYALSAQENVCLWHERDISHSSVERVIAPDACILIDFMLARFRRLIEGMQVYPDRMLANLESTRGLVFSGSVLLALTDCGMTREAAYAVVQKHALEALKGGEDLRARLKSDSEITAHLKDKELLELFDLKRHLRHVDNIFARVGIR